MQAAVLMYVDARANSGAGDAPAALPWTRWVASRKDAGSASTTMERHKRPSASAMALARKRQRKRQQELGDTASEASNEPDDDDDEEEEITAFVEYNANDMDSLDINPSQDFDGEISVRGDADNYRRRTASCIRKEDDSEEASEVFDNVIYAPRPCDSKPVTGASVAGESSFPSQVQAQTESKLIPQQSPLPEEEEEDDDSLSDGFEIDTDLFNALKQTRQTSSRNHESAPSANQLLWRQRRSIKRDCTFVDTDIQCGPNSCRRTDANPRSSIKVIELDADEDSIESIDGCSLAESSSRSPRAPLNGASRATSTSLVLASRNPVPQPPLQKRRRKMEYQLTLDGFFRCRPFK